MLLASLFLVLGTAWAQTRVLKLTDEQIGTYPYELPEADAQKVFALGELTVAVKVNTVTFSSIANDRMALFCTSDPTKAANTAAEGTNSRYVAFGTSANAVGYLASAKVGDRFTTSSLPADTKDVVLVFTISPSTLNMYRNGEKIQTWNNPFMSGYEIATPKMVKEDHGDAKIYIGGGKTSEGARELFNGTITGVEVYSGILTAEQVKNVFPPVTGKVYQLKGKHDGAYVYADANNGRLKPAATGNAEQYNQLWVLGTSTNDGKYTLRNAATKGYMKAVTGQNEAWYAPKEFADLYIVERTAATETDPTYFNLSNAGDAAGYTCLHCYNGTDGKSWTGDGGGSQFAFVEVTSVTVASLAALAIRDELNPLITEANGLKDNTILAGSTELTALSTALTTANGLTSSQDWDAVLAAVAPLATAIANAEKYIEDHPVEEFEPTDLYALKSPTGTYLNFTPITTQGTTTQASFQNEPSFLYKIEENGSFAFQSFDDDDAYVGATDRWLVTKAKSLWNISAEDANGYVTISRSTDANARLGHDGNTNKGTGIFTNVGNTCFGWQLIPAYPVTIIYKNSNGVEIETVKAATIAGTGYSFTVDTKGGTLVSCVADKGTMTETDGTYSFAAVNGATTVTVTVAIELEAGKAFVFKEKTSGLYLDIRTLGIKDGGRNTNNISLSSKPYPIYLESGSADGKWKMKNANGKYVFHKTAGTDGHWNPEIGEQSSEWSISKSNEGGFTIARAADGKYLNVDTKAAGKPLYCDKASGMQFELLNYDDVDFITGAGLGKEGAEGPYVAIKEIDADGTTTTLPVGMGWILTVEVENPNGASHGQWGSSILATGKEPFPYKDKHNGFQLYLQSGTNGDKKLDVVFSNADHIVNNVSYTGDFKAVITYDGTSKLDVVTTNAAGTEATNNYTISLPEISEFAYGLPTGINIKRLSIEIIEKEYTFALGTTPEGQAVTVTYGDETIEVGATIKESELDLLKFAATEVPGYAWAVVADKAANTLTLNYTQAEVADLQAVKDLVDRIGGAGTADKFMFVHTPWLNSKQETFKLGTEDGKIRIEGTTISAITTGLGWYLNNIAHINIAWNSLNEKTVSGAAYVDLTNIELPLPSEETHTSDAKYRYYLNYCTFGYSMTSWTWKRWQQEIDWMALHGINMPLQIVGLEEVWRRFLTMEENGQRKYGYSDEEAMAFVPGPAYTAWWGMNNLQGWGGTGAGDKIKTASDGTVCEGTGGVQNKAWFDRQLQLATSILARQRELGMQPVLPGFSGMVPSNFTEKTGVTTDQNNVDWQSFLRPSIIDPTATRFAEVAEDYYACLKDVMGESQYYSMDPFHEGGKINSGLYSEAYSAIYDAMEAAKAGSQWVIQQWHWTENQQKSTSAVPAGRLIVLDLFSDGRPGFSAYGGYNPQDAVFCAIPNFGGRSGLMGRLQNVTDNYFAFKNQYASIKGIGTAPEAIEQTPVTYDLIYQLPWMNGVQPNVAEWVDNYAIARYGKDNAVVKEAWSLLRQSVLAYGADGIEGPIEDVWAARPNLDANPASKWGKTMSFAINTYTKERHQKLINAVYKLIDQQEELDLQSGSVYESNYLYDLVEFGGGVMADYAYYLLLGIKEAKNAAGENFASDDTYKARRDAFLQLILDMDAFRGTNLNFRLGKWTQEARDAAKEVEGWSTATQDWYEFNNARTLITTWTYKSHGLNDYSYRSWQGLLADYYYPRWEYYFDNNCNGTNYFFFEWNWAHGMTHQVGDTQKSTTPLAEGAKGYSYSRTPEGNTVEKAVEMLGKYIIPIKYNDGTTYYAYRTFNTDLTAKVTITVAAGATVDFTQYFDVPADAVVTGSVVNNNEQSANIKAVPVVAEGESLTGTITLTDGTVLSKFSVELVQFNGYYHISYEANPMFIGYNTYKNDTNYDVDGYKLIAGGVYTPEAEADKVFAIVPKDGGYTISAQGKYLEYPFFNWWKHVMFSDDEDAAGVYVFEDVESLSDVFKIRGVGEDDGDWVHNNYLQVYAPNSIVANTIVGSAHSFTITPAETYNVTLSGKGFLPLCLPFNVVLPEGVEACDINDLSKEKLMMGSEGLFTTIATTGQIVKAGTPVILKGTANESYDLGITLNNNGAKTSLAGSVLRGNYVKQTVTPGDDIKKYVLNGETFEIITSNREIPANSCWVEANIEGEEIELVPVIIEIKPDEGSDDESWKFRVKKTGKDGLTITDCVLSGGGHLKIGSHYEVDGEYREVNALSDDFLHDNLDIEEVTLPSTLTSVGGNYANYMFEIAYKGADYGFDRNVGVPKDESNEAYNESVAEAEGWMGVSHPCHYKVLAASTWRMTVDVKFTEGATHFNDFGSCLFATKENTLSNNYNDGSMQLYLRRDKGVVFKLDSTGDIHVFNKGNEQGLGDTFSFTFVLDNNGAGAYTAKMIFENGAEEEFIILADDHAELHDFNTIWSSLGSGVEVNVQFDKLTTRGLFVGCKNLKAIHVDDKNESFSGCGHGVLYNKSMTHVIRFPEGGGEKKEDCHFEDVDHRHFELPRTVTKIYAGALHDVNAHIIFHSNPLIMSVEDPDDPDHTAHHVAAKYHLVIEDDAEVVDFHSGNTNMYQTLQYKRAPLAKGTYGTIVLPFAPNNATKKYDFFELYSADAEGLIFSQVDEVKANTPYLYKLKDVVNEDIAIVENEKTIDVFTGVTTQIQSVGHNPSVNKDEWESVGCYVTESVMTETDPANHYYYFSIKENAFLYVTKKLNVKPYRAFFVVPATTAAQAPAQLSLRITRNDGSTTEIYPSQVEGMETPIYYDLQGRRVENPTSGVYIVNGKKVVIR